MKSVLTSLLVFLCLNTLAIPQWNLNDVSYLFQVPKIQSDAPEYLLSPLHRGAKGLLLPRSVYDEIPNVVAGSSNLRIYKNSLKVVGARFDSCPAIQVGKCVAELRLIWQPVEYKESYKEWHALDGAVHSFYHLTKSEIDQLKKDLWKLKINNLNKGIDTNLIPLGIHPALSHKKTSEKFNSDLKTILLKFAGEQNLKKVTFMSLLVSTRWWRFGSFELQNDKSWKRVDIPRMHSNFVDIFNTAHEETSAYNIPGKKMNGVINIFPDDYPQEDNILPVINRADRFGDDRDYTVFLTKIDAVRRFQNPHKTNPDVLDCASCHIADATLFYANSRFPGLDREPSADEYINPNPQIFNLENITIAKKATRIVRAFGFFGGLPAVNQRAINESAEVANWLNTH